MEEKKQNSLALILAEKRSTCVITASVTDSAERDNNRRGKMVRGVWASDSAAVLSFRFSPFDR